MSNTLNWRFRHFDLFSASEWHAMLNLRSSIFVVEQTCPYLDPDGKDPDCWHLEGLMQGQLPLHQSLKVPAVWILAVGV